MADATTNYAAVSDDALPIYIEERMIRLSERQLLLGGMTCEKFTLPERMGKTMRINRYGRITNPTATLTEGSPPDAVALSVTKVEATVEQWGIVGLITDVAELTIKHPLLTIMIDRTSRAINETKEREIATVLMGGTSVFYAGAATTRATITASTIITTGDCTDITVTLRDNGAGDWDGLMIGILPPQMEGDIMGDSTFANAASYSQVVRLNVAEIGTWGGVRWSRMNFLPKFKGIAAPGTQGAEIAGYGNETGAGAGIGGAHVVVIAKDIQSGYERKISQDKAVGAGKDTADVTTPTSTNYVYDIYQTTTTNTVPKRVFTSVAANTVKTLTTTTYTNGETRTPTSAPATGVTAYMAFVFGREAYGDVQLSGMSIQSFVTPPGASYSNPLAQGRKIGNKYMAKPTLLDNNYFARLEAGSGKPDTLPA